MVVQVNKCYENNIAISENTSTLKEECEDDDFIDDKVLVSETVVMAVKSDLEDRLKYNLITEHEVFSAFDNTKTELSLSEEQNNMINDSVKVEDGINPDVKIEFDNGLSFCEQCNVYCQDYCTDCGMVVHILNKDALNNIDNGTQEELPTNILQIQESFGQLGIFALRVIPKDVKFGLFTGLNASQSNWKLKGGKFIVGADKSKYLNWMQYINPARSRSEQNLLTFQYEGNLYYQTTHEIQEGEELLVYFGERYEDSLNRNIEMDFVPITEQNFKDVFACTFCCLGFSTRTYLTKHKAICLDYSKGKFSVEELVQCPYCKIYLDEKEYTEYHMVSCSRRNIRNCTPLVSDNQTVDVKRGRRRLQMYYCTQCNYKTKFKGDLGSHSCQHCSVKMHKCRICYKQFKTKKYLQMHVEKLHINVKGIHFLKYFRSDANLEVRKKTKHVKEFKYDCESCKYKANTKACLERHIKTKHLKRFDYRCGTCEYKTNMKVNLEFHLKSKHLKEFDYNCDMCKYKTNNKANLKIHIKSVHIKEFNYRCEMCEYKTNLKSHLETHTKAKHLKKFDYNCDMCEYKTNNKANFELHIKSVHIKEFNYRCGICQYKTNSKICLERHTKTIHLKEFDYKCEMCEFKTNHRAHLQNHIKSIHIKEFNYKCGTCGYQTNSKSSLKKHTKTVHFKEFDYKCEICECKTNNKSYIQRHLKSKHLNEFDYKCDKCEYKTNLKSHLERHTKTTHVIECDYKCDMCEYKTYSELYMKRHLKSKHCKNFDYNCDICEYKTSQKVHLEMHIKSRHIKEFKFKCGMCEFKTNAKSNLNKHTKIVHLKEFDYKCDMCEYKTNTKTHLERHTKTVHLVEFDYKCDMCEYKTNVKAHLGVHTKAVHLKIFNFNCTICDYKTNIISRFNTHVKRKHSQ